MTERTKALNSTVSTLKKNPGRIGHLVKTAKALIVPPKQYAAGKTKKLLEAAIKKLKAKRGLNGAVDGGAGPFSDKVINKQLGEKTKVTSATGHKKEAMEQKRKDQVLAGSAVASGAALGGALAHDVKKSRIASRLATKGAYKHMGDASVAGAEKRLARASKVMARMGKPLRRAGIKGAVIGGLAGAALGAAHLKKQASEFLGKGKIPAGAKDVTPGAQPKAKAKAKVKPQATGTQLARVSRTQYIGKNKIPAGAKNVTHTLLKRKAGKIAAGVAAGSAIAYAAKKHLEKKAEKDKKVSVPGLAMSGALTGFGIRQARDSATAAKGLMKQEKHILSKGGRLNPIDYKMAIKSFEKPMARRALKAAGKGAAVGALTAAAVNRLRKKDKK